MVIMTLFLAFLACAPNYLDVPVKTVGVGYDPEEVGPSPTPYGGVVEYSWVNFAGGGLSLALMQLGSFDEVGPGMSGFAPPYAAVYGFSYLFTEKLAAADSLGGVTSVPPEAEDSCYTTFEASGPIGSFKTVDVGDYMELVTEDGSGGLRLDRYPEQYASDPRDAFAYYNKFELWSQNPIYGLYPGDSEKISKMGEILVRGATFPSGERVTYRFPGGMVPQYAPLGSIPVPSSVVESTELRVPQLPGGVSLEWTGPRYDSIGETTEAGGAHSTCLAFSADAAKEPQGPGDCAAAMSAQADAGQMYTGPWDTDDGQVSFRWEPSENPDEFVSIAVRFLGPVDRDDPNYQAELVSEPIPKSVKGEWNGRRGESVPDEEPPDGTRSPTACEEEGAYGFDPRYLDGAGELITAMRGDPFHNMAEVTCRMKDDGEFALTEAMVADALAYARAHGSEGVVFYFGRSTEAEVEVPDAMDNYGNRKVITPIKVASRAIDIGRFWFEE
ncbi:hypothetical protein LBMAG42_51220 [Deltaproteobacteria bacterium]|nr:hypothetical protein LBMAG42_51220 [Deltaproteobacteria bacterium]